MNNHQIDELLRSRADTRNVFGGVHAADTLPERPRERKPCAYVVNTAPLDKAGEHWVVIYFPRKPLPPEYFDSYGRAPEEKFRRFLGTEKHIYNGTLVQSLFSTACGMHAVYYVWCRCNDMTMENVLNSYHPEDRALNDRMVSNKIGELFGRRYETYNLGFILSL